MFLYVSAYATSMDDLRALQIIGTPEGSYETSFCFSRCFLGIVSLVFSKFWHGARNPYEAVFLQSWIL